MAKSLLEAADALDPDSTSLIKSYAYAATHRPPLQTTRAGAIQHNKPPRFRVEKGYDAPFFPAPALLFCKRSIDGVWH